MSLKGDGRWHSHWFIARYAQTTPTQARAEGGAMGARAPALFPLKDQSALLSGHLNFQCFVKLHMNN